MLNVQCPQCRNKNRNEILMKATDHDIIIATGQKYSMNLSKFRMSQCLAAAQTMEMKTK